MVNYRRPYLVASIDDVLNKSKISIKELNKTVGNEGASASDYQVIANFAHGFEDYNSVFERAVTANDKTIYWYAIVPKNAKVEKAGVQVEWFVEGVGNHMQLHLSLDKNILLIPSSINEGAQSFVGENGLKVEDRTGSLINIFGDTSKPVLIKGEMIYALMGLKAFGGPQEFSFVNSITGNLLIGLTLSSSAHMATDQMSRGSYVEEYSLLLSDEELQKELNYVLEPNFETNPTANIYNTVFQNCIKELLNAVDFATSGRSKFKFSTDQYNPYTVPNYLKKTGVIASKPINLNQVFGAPNQTRENDQNKDAIAKTNLALKAMPPEKLDIFVRQLAYNAAVRKWKQESINGYFGLVMSELKSAKGIEALALGSYLDENDLWKNNPDKEQIKEIDSVLKGIVLDIIKDEAMIKLDKAIADFKAGKKLKGFKITGADIAKAQEYRKKYGDYLAALLKLSSLGPM